MAVAVPVAVSSKPLYIFCAGIGFSLCSFGAAAVSAT